MCSEMTWAAFSVWTDAVAMLVTELENAVRVGEGMRLPAIQDPLGPIELRPPVVYPLKIHRALRIA